MHEYWHMGETPIRFRNVTARIVNGVNSAMSVLLVLPVIVPPGQSRPCEIMRAMINLTLDGAWRFRKAGDRAWMPATVPGSNFTDLLALGKIPDPFTHDHELAVTWVFRAGWEYEREVQVPASLLGCDTVWLECGGLDTLAEVRINGRLAGTTANMYMPHRFDVKGLLRPGRNTIRVAFASPVIEKPRNAAEKLAGGDPHSVPGGALLRKAACHYGWDWGPQLPPTGIWRSLRLAGRDTARLSDIHVRQSTTKSRATVGIRVAAERWRPGALRARVSLTGPGGLAVTRVVPLGRGDEASVALVVNRPALWWPNGLGARPLYSLRVELLGARGEVLDLDAKRLGLRTIELERKRDRWGESFTFVVNGIPIFAKGADWIPADSFPTRMTRERYADLLGSAAAANMNMVRVWGGGFYENEDFYDLCDELGLLVWQDFMFACMRYPGHAEFVDNFHGEAVAALRRLRHRACLALWCGNNEMESGWAEWGWKGRAPAAAMRVYDAMFHHLLPAWVKAEDPDTTYWPSSPSSGGGFKDPGGQSKGDGHDWSVWHGRRPFTEYRKHYHRFMSEFGFQSLPDLRTVEHFAPKSEWNMTSWTMERHQKNWAGNQIIMHYLCETFRIPKDFPSLVYTSQLLQAEAMRYGVEHWRRHRGRCNGAIVWQLNDCWPVVSWASIDYFGRWKALHYLERRFFEPVLLSAEESGTRVRLHVSNDEVAPFRGEVRWRLETVAGRRLARGRRRVRAKPLADTLVADLDFSRPIGDRNRRDLVCVFELRGDGGRRSSGVVGFVPIKHLELVDPGLKAAVRPATGASAPAWAVTVNAKSLARFVCVSIEGRDCVWSDNFFDLPAGESRTVTCPRRPGETAAALRSRLRLTDLHASYA